MTAKRNQKKKPTKKNRLKGASPKKHYVTRGRFESKDLPFLRRAAVVATGTEVTSGQIVNSNASWISAQLTQLGIEVVLHLAAPDDPDRITEALSVARNTAELVIVVGGLGPTRDDLTRSVIAKNFGRPLIFDRQAWQRLKKSLEKFGRQASSIFRRQCFFPKEAKLLLNEVGNADGFLLEWKGSLIAALPGPPAELQPMWSRHLLPLLNPRIPPPEQRLLTWLCLGKPEAELAELVEKSLAPLPRGARLGYRLMTPYVEVKLWVPAFSSASQNAYFEKFIAKMDRLLTPWKKGQNGEDLGDHFLKSLQAAGISVVVEDSVAPFLLTERLLALLRKPEYQDMLKHFSFITGASATLGAPKAREATREANRYRLGYSAGENFTTSVRFLAPDQTTSSHILHPLFPTSAVMRNQKASVELALDWWAQELSAESRASWRQF